MRSKTFFAFACNASAKQAGRIRRDFIAGKISETEFHAARERQDKVSNARIEVVLVRTIPGYVSRLSK